MLDSNRRWILGFVLVMLAVTIWELPVAAQGSTVKGTFVVGGTDAGLKHVRAQRTALDEKTKGFVVLFSAKPAEGDITDWRMADPKERGSFIYLMLEESGAVWVAELGHANAKTGRFGVVTELEKQSFAVAGDRLKARFATRGEQTFGDDRYTVDLEIDAPLEK